MKRLHAKIGRIFWSRGFLKTVLWTATLILLFYAEENWRGARAWAATKAEWEAKGVSFDQQTYIPKPIPDDQNLAAIPLFRQKSPNPKDPAYGEPLTLKKALRRDQVGSELPAIGNRQRGELPDMAQIRIAVAKAYAEAFKNTPPPADSIDQLDALYPCLADLRQASASRPLCYFKQDYTLPLPMARPIGLLTAQVQVSRLLTLHAILALAAHQPDLALDDLKTNFKLMNGLRRDPTLLAGLIAGALNIFGDDVIADGLALHAWNDSQLAEIEDQLVQVDFLQTYRLVMPGEAVTEVVPDIDFTATRRSLSIVAYFNRTPDTSGAPFSTWVTSLWANGWYDQNKSKAVAALLDVAETIDPKSRLVFPKRADDLEDKFNASVSGWDEDAPWNILFAESVSVAIGSTPRFAQNQAMVDQARLACALERFRLAQGSYPDSLQALAPAYVDAVPRDIMNGEPYRYRLRSDGTFLLYSVGWNQKDDGGKIVYQAGYSKTIDDKQGDWVWPTPKADEEKSP